MRKNELKAHFHLHLNWIFCSQWPSCGKLIVSLKYQTYFKTFFPSIPLRSIRFRPGCGPACSARGRGGPLAGSCSVWKARLRLWSENIHTGEDLTAANPSTAVQNYHRDGGRRESSQRNCVCCGTSNQTRLFFFFCCCF